MTQIHKAVAIVTTAVVTVSPPTTCIAPCAGGIRKPDFKQPTPLPVKVNKVPAKLSAKDRHMSSKHVTSSANDNNAFHRKVFPAKKGLPVADNISLVPVMEQQASLIVQNNQNIVWNKQEAAYDKVNQKIDKLYNDLLDLLKDTRLIFRELIPHLELVHKKTNHALVTGYFQKGAFFPWSANVFKIFDVQIRKINRALYDSMKHRDNLRYANCADSQYIVVPLVPLPEDGPYSGKRDVKKVSQRKLRREEYDALTDEERLYADMYPISGNIPSKRSTRKKGKKCDKSSKLFDRNKKRGRNHKYANRNLAMQQWEEEPKKQEYVSMFDYELLPSCGDPGYEDTTITDEATPYVEIINAYYNYTQEEILSIAEAYHLLANYTAALKSGDEKSIAIAAIMLEHPAVYDAAYAMHRIANNR